MTKLTLLLLFFAAPLLALAQTVPNPGFENWTADTSGQYLQPDGWHSTNEQTGNIGGIAISRDSVAYSGTYAASIQTVYVGFAGQPYAGVLTNGYYVDNGGGFSILGGSPVSYTPDTFSFQYKYTTTDTTKGRALIYFYKRVNATTRMLVGFGQKDLDNASNFTLVNIRIGKDSLRTPADSILVIFQSCRELGAPKSGTLVVDDIGLAANHTGITEVQADIAVEVFPNPATDFVTIKIPADQPVANTISIYSVDGKLQQQTINNSKDYQLKVNTSQLSTGNYFVRVQWADGRFVNRNIIISK